MSSSRAGLTWLQELAWLTLSALVVGCLVVPGLAVYGLYYQLTRRAPAERERIERDF